MRAGPLAGLRAATVISVSSVWTVDPDDRCGEDQRASRITARK